MSQQTAWLVVCGLVIAAALAYSTYVIWRVLRNVQFDERQRRAQVAIVLCLPVLGAMLVHLVHYQINNPSRSRRDGILNQEHNNAGGD